MFNKKKKHWYNHKPNYKRMDSQAGDNMQANTDTGKPETQSAPVLTEELSAVPSIQEPLPLKNISLSDDNPLATLSPAEGKKEEPSTDVQCKICNMPIRNHYTAIRRKESGELSHFDCVLRELSKENLPKLGKFKRIYYIGSGDFAIVKEFYDKRGHLKNYEIIEKINYENKA
jgi:hypothetical protein